MGEEGGVSSEAPRLSPSISSEGQPVIPKDAVAESLVDPAVLLPYTHTHTHTCGEQPDILPPNCPSPLTARERVEECSRCTGF